MNNKRHSISPEMWALMSRRAREHVMSIRLLDRLDAAERGATREQFAFAARTAARAILRARYGARRQLFLRDVDPGR